MPADLKALHDALEVAEAARQAAADAFAAATVAALPDGGEATTNPTPVVIYTRKGEEVHRRVIQPLPTGASA